jgi:uncharacterized protein YueI
MLSKKSREQVKHLKKELKMKEEQYKKLLKTPLSYDTLKEIIDENKEHQIEIKLISGDRIIITPYQELSKPHGYNGNGTAFEGNW